MKEEFKEWEKAYLSANDAVIKAAIELTRLCGGDITTAHVIDTLTEVASRLRYKALQTNIQDLLYSVSGGEKGV